MTPSRITVPYGPDPMEYMEILIPAYFGGITVARFHGGAFTSPDPVDPTAKPWADLLRDGKAIADCSYPLGPGGFYSGQWKSVGRANAFLINEGARLGLDPEKLGVWGQSAGGILTLVHQYDPTSLDVFEFHVIEQAVSDWPKAALAGTFFGKPLASVPIADLQAASAVWRIEHSVNPPFPTFGITDEIAIPFQPNGPPITHNHAPEWTKYLGDAIEAVPFNDPSEWMSYYRGIPNLDMTEVTSWMDGIFR